MPTSGRVARHREPSLPLSRERIVEASIELLDRHGEEGLTFRALSQRLATGPGAIYWHVTDKSDLLGAACDALVERALVNRAGATPEATIRSLALRLFDLMVEHPWVGLTLTGLSGQSSIVRVLEPIGQQVRALGVSPARQRAAAGTLMSYILGVSRQNAANRELARTHDLDRRAFLEALSSAWAQLDPVSYPFTRSMAAAMRDHDDRADFIAGIDLILVGIRASRLRRA